MQKKGRVVILNGVGSAGKGSIAKALQTITVEPFLHVEMDAFLAMLPEHLWNHVDGMIFETIQEDGKPSVAIKTGPVVDKLMAGMRRAIAAMAEQGNNLIVDDVMTEVEASDYRRLLEGLDVAMVGVFASLDTLEERERARGDRMIGLARRQHARVHQGIAYDLEIDTTQATPQACAEKIKTALKLWIKSPARALSPDK
jgi:chloramphenicol 3-O phosphotransferase